MIGAFMESRYTVHVTRNGKGYICRVDYNNVPLVQARVRNRQHVGPCCRDLLRTLDKLGGDAYTHRARMRRNEKPVNYQTGFEWCPYWKYEWLR